MSTVANKSGTGPTDPDMEKVELQGGPFDGRYIAVGREVTGATVPLFVDGKPDPTMHEYVRSDITVPVFLHNGSQRCFGGDATRD